MKKIFLIILALPLLVLAEDEATPFPTGRVAAEGQSPTDAFKSGGARATPVGTDADPACAMCVQNKLRLDAKRTNADSKTNTTTTPSTGTQVKTEN